LLLTTRRQSPPMMSPCMLVAAGPPRAHKRGIFVCGILPGEMAGIEQMKFAVLQPLMEIFGVDGRDDRVPATRDDLHGRQDVWENISKEFELRRVGLRVGNRFRESMAFVRCQVVLAGGLAGCIALQRLNRPLDDRTSTNASIRFQVWCIDPFAQRV